LFITRNLKQKLQRKSAKSETSGADLYPVVLVYTCINCLQASQVT